MTACTDSVTTQIVWNDAINVCATRTTTIEDGIEDIVDVVADKAICCTPEVDQDDVDYCLIIDSGNLVAYDVDDGECVKLEGSLINGDEYAITTTLD